MEASTFFAAGLRSGYENSSYHVGDRLVYHSIKVNPGGQYNKTTGEYSCEKTGVYFFTYSVFGVHIDNEGIISKASACLTKQGARQGRIHFRNENTKSIYITLSQSLVLQCNAGEKVWVESVDDNNYIYGETFYNVFAGFLLFLT